MANQNPICGGQLVSLGLPAEHISILRIRLTDWRDGAREDLQTPDRLQDPDRCRQEAEAFERLLVALTTGQVFIPDELALMFFREAANGYDKESSYAEIATNHDAMRGLQCALERNRA